MPRRRLSGPTQVEILVEARAKLAEVEELLGKIDLRSTGVELRGEIKDARGAVDSALDSCASAIQVA